MNFTRAFTHYVSVALLFLWGSVLLYFYASGRIINYLPPDGIFQPMVLIAGVGLMILGLFNLLTSNATELDCGHDHSHDSAHAHAHTGCCGHDHDHDHDHDHNHGHAHAHDHTDCGHDHAHDHDHATCGHDHSHDHAHQEHDHDHTHAHGMLEESGWTGRFVAIAILAIPITLAALNSPDQFSPRVAENKGLYTPNYADTTRADQFSLKKATSPTSALADLTAPARSTSPDAPPAPTPAVATGPGAAPAATPTMDAPPAKATTPAGTDAPATASGGSSSATPPAAQSYGSFTLADLEAQVPKSEAGNFILDVPEIYYTGGDVEVQSVLKGQSVETIAQILPEKVNNDDGHRLRIFRMLVQCCAADARPYSIPVDFGKKAPDYKEMSWVKIVGTMTYKQEGGQTVPVLEAKTIEETTAPDQTMIY